MRSHPHDHIIESARAHGMRLMPVLENYCEAYGGIGTRLRRQGLSGGQPARAASFDKDPPPRALHLVQELRELRTDPYEPLLRRRVQGP
ncbi:hypothetical protein ACWF9B_12170 [Streptomyces sp. NPDC055089]